MLPSHIGQYRILRKIGAGGMGLVYLGEHTLLGRRAAIKTLLPTVAANHEIVERFFNEARATSAIADPGVIQIFDFGYHVDGTAYIVMELLEGEALSARLDRLGKLPLGDALRFGRQIASSLAAAHARDIIHRDLKPENIFLVRDTEAQGGVRTKIIDFGICKMGAGDPMLTEVGVMIGTPVYMSPEQCRGSGEVDHRSDVYAFGCLLFHLITGRPPFIGDASGELIVAHLQEPPPAASQYVPGLPEAVDALLACCLAKSPDERFASMEALGTALAELAVHAESFAPSATPPPATVPLGRGFRSVFDANLAAAVGGSRFGATPRLRFSPPPDAPRLEIIDDDDDFEELEIVAPRRRRVVRAALACVLVVGVALGLALTPLVLGDDDDERAPPAKQTAARPAALPIEAPPAAEPTLADEPAGRSAVNAAASSAAVAADHVAERADEAPPAGEPSQVAASAAAAADESTARPADEAAPTADEAPPAAGKAPAPRSHASAPRGKALATASRASRPARSAPASVASGPVRTPSQAAGTGPVRAPSQAAAGDPVRSPAAAASLAAVPPAAPPRTPAMPVLTPMTPSPSPSPSSSPVSATAAAPRLAPELAPPAPPAPPTEDLYDSR